jgi:curved DNA-binding protein CbpA
MKNRRNYYRILQVQPDAPMEIINSCYRTLMHKLRHHPDLGGDHWNASIINAAYETLSDPRRRAEYDRKLFEHYVKIPPRKKDTKKKPFISIFCPFCKRPLACKAKPGENCPTCRSPLQSSHDIEALNRNCRRSIDRMKKSGSILYYSHWPQRGQEADILDLSPGGIRFICAGGLRRGDVIKLSGPLLKAIAKATHIQKKELDGKTYYIVGAELVTVRFANPKGTFTSISV